MEWQPIETAPKDGRQLFLYLSDGQTVIAEFSVRRDGSSYWEVCHTENGAICLRTEATHWMPLPEPPK